MDPADPSSAESIDYHDCYEYRRLNVTLRALIDCRRALTHAADESAYLAEVCRIVVEDCGYDVAWIGFAGDDAEESIRPVAQAGTDPLDLRAIRLPSADLDRVRGGSSVVLPLVSAGRPFGAVSIDARAPDTFSDEDLKLLTELADDVAHGVMEIRRRGAHARAEEALRQGEERYRGLVHLSPDAVFVNRRDRIEFVNPAALLLFGATDAAQILGRSPYDLFHPDCHPVMRERIRLMMEGLHAPLLEEKIVRLDGVVRDVEVAAAPFDDEEGRAVQVIMRDITERKAAEEALRQSEQRSRMSAEALRQADRAKDEFLAVLSHELRNPLTPIMNSLYLLKRAAPDGEDARFSREVIERQVGQLTRLVDDLLDSTRISRNKIHLHTERLDLGDVVRRVLEDHRSIFEENGISLESEVACDPIFVKADSARTAQVIGNLMHNAGKFTPRGGRARVTVEADRVQGTAIVRVTDTGVGMDPEMIARLFNPFVQAQMTLDRSRGGLGLGLALVKGIVEMHGGSVEAHSDGVGRGSKFVVRLPLDSCEGAGPEPSRALGLRQAMRVLIIEDNVDAAESLRRLLETQGHEVRIGRDGAHGLDLARECRPAIVLCDIGLPGIDGFEVVRRMRSDDALSGAFIVALSGYARPEDLRKSVESGFDRHIAKPATMEMLNAVLRDAAERRGGES